MIQRVWNNYRQYGLLRFSTRAVKRLFSDLVHMETYVIAEAQLSELPPRPTTTLDCRIERLTEADIPVIPVDRSKQGLFTERIQSGQNVCLAARVGEDIAYFSWIALDKAMVAGYQIPLSPEEGFLFDAWCSPAYRGHRLHQFISWHRMQHLHDLGRRRAQVAYIKDNRIAHRTMQALGFAQAYALRVVGIGSKRFYCKR